MSYVPAEHTTQVWYDLINSSAAMSQHDRRRWRIKFMLKALIIWTVVLTIAVAITLMCVRFGPETPIATGSEYRPTGVGPTNYGRDKSHVISKSSAVVAINLTAVETPMNVLTTGLHLDDGKQSLKNDLAFDEPIRTISGAFDKDLVRKDRIPVDSLISRSSNQKHQDDNTATMVFGDKSEAIVGTGPYQTNTDRRGEYEKVTNQSDHSLPETGKLMADEDASTAFDSTVFDVDAGDIGYNYQSPVVGTGWITMNRPEQVHPESSWSTGGHGGQPAAHRGVGEPCHGYKSLDPPTAVLPQHYQKPQATKSHDGVDWHKLGMLALIKLGLLKLQAIGFLKVLMLLVFKVKLFMAAAFFKFLLTAKLMKLYKILILPLFWMQLMPALAQLLSLPPRVIDTVTRRPVTPRPSRPSSSSGTAGGTTTTTTTTVIRPGTGGTNTVQRPGGTNQFSLNKLDNPSIDDPHDFQSSTDPFDPTSTILQNILESEKCVERIACRIAVTEKAGILPFWINWMLHRMSKYIPNDKLESYLKTYKDVNNEIYTMSSNPDNWNTWCSERYDCIDDK